MLAVVKIRGTELDEKEYSQYRVADREQHVVDHGFDLYSPRRCIDNGPMEGFWGMIKSEMYYLQRFHIFEELQQAIDEYMKFYNMRRQQKKLKGLTPYEYRDQTFTA